VLADTFHMNIEEVDLPLALRQAGDRLWHVHTADSNRWAPGQGHLDFATLIDTLTDLEYDGYLSCEILPRPTPEEAVRLGAEGLKRLLGRGSQR
jgi:sugar phosphate isomerase/epimerase